MDEVTTLGTPVDGVHVVGSLSPSRARDFRTCPLLYRLRTLDRLPETPSPAAARGTVVHRVLERLFDLPSEQRTRARAETLVPDAWAEVREEEPGLADVLETAGLEEAAWLASCRDSVRRWFDLEDPRVLEPAGRELYVETVLESKLLLRGVVDRLDVAADGAVRIVDYKTGSSPPVGREAGALFQLRFYALVLWRTRGVVPSHLRLVYLGDGQLVGYRPDEAELLATQTLLEALWEAIDTAHRSGEWLPSPGPACRWCSFQSLCPAFGNEPPPLPETLPAPETAGVPAGLTADLTAATGDAPPTAPLPSGR